MGKVNVNKEEKWERERSGKVRDLNDISAGRGAAVDPKIHIAQENLIPEPRKNSRPDGQFS